MRTVLGIFVLTLIAGAAYGQTDKVPLGVECTNGVNDTVGESFCTALRDAVAASPRYRLDSSQNRYVLHVATVDTDQGSPVRGYQSVEALTLTLQNGNDEAYIYTRVQYTPFNQAEQAAKQVLSGADAIIAPAMDRLRRQQKLNSR